MGGVDAGRLLDRHSRDLISLRSTLCEAGVEMNGVGGSFSEVVDGKDRSDLCFSGCNISSQTLG